MANKNKETAAEIRAREEESSVFQNPAVEEGVNDLGEFGIDLFDESTEETGEFNPNPNTAPGAENVTLGVVTNPSASPEDLVHDEHGNVRPEFAPLGVGEVTAEDVIQSGRFELRRREDGEYDAYDRDSGSLVAVGVSADPAVLAKYSR